MGLEAYRMVTTWQPWADLLVPSQSTLDYLLIANPRMAEMLPKDIENRTRSTPWTGILLIHAAGKVDMEAMRLFGLDPARFVRGAVVGTVHLDGVTTDSPSWWAKDGAQQWQVSRPVRLDNPVRCPGVRSARKPPPAILAAVLAQLSRQTAVA